MNTDLTDKQKVAIGHISGLVLINALIFQEVLSEHDGRVIPLRKILSEKDPQSAFSDHWNFILTEINYYPIFHIAREILLDLTASKDVMAALKDLAESARNIVSLRAALRHDLMGRVYHRLLVEAKYLGTYYTGIPAATLLLKLALKPYDWDVDWHDLDEVKNFRIADLACGTGTLLMAAADALTDNYIRYCVDEHENVDISKLNNVLAEEVLCGYDVLPSAIHLTASTVALRAPEITFTKMNLFSMPLGGPHYRLGSIEFARDRDVHEVKDLFGSLSEIEQVTGKSKGKEAATPASVPDIDLCVMNPPFTRSVGGNLLFGSLPDKERKEMQKNLKALVDDYHLKASITAGLGSVFTAIADKYIKPEGRIALVLPKALISGVAWNKTRELLRQKYELDYLIASHDPERWNFSESTDLSEVLLVASKKSGQSDKKHYVTAVNLWRNPTTSFEALAIANSLAKDTPPDVETGQGARELRIGDKKVGEAISFPWDNIKPQPIWILPCAFAQADLTRAAYHLINGNLWLPGLGKSGSLPLCPLSGLASLGPDRRDIHDGFSLSKTKTSYPAFWGHTAKDTHTLEQSHNLYLSPLASAKKGRPLRKVEDLWPLAGSVLIAERLRLNTIRLAAIRLPHPVLSNVWWPLALKPKVKTYQNEKILALWLNSTLGLMILLSHRVETEGAWIDFKKPILSEMPILDVTALSSKQRRALASAYGRLAKKSLLPLPSMNVDPVRAEIDKAISETLELPDLSVLRELLAQEPVVCLRRI